MENLRARSTLRAQNLQEVTPMTKKEIFLTAIVAPLIVAIVGGLEVLLVKGKIENQKPAITVESEAEALKVTNNTDQILTIRVAYLVADGKGATYCYPNPTYADGQQDPRLLPKETRTFPAGKCGNNFNDFVIWAWDAKKKLVYTNKP